MNRATVVIIGAGQAGLATSHLLADAGVEHVVLERGRVAARWDGHAWRSLRLLTPNWLSRLPGHRYRGTDPNGYMRASEVADYLRSYAVRSGAPVRQGVEVLAVRGGGDGGYRVETTNGTWTAAAVVVATGWCDVSRRPAAASGLDGRIEQLTPATYRDPAALPDGGVLVVGASSSGVQIADELATAGRRVVLAVGSHSRVPRTYRGRDICWWLDAVGSLGRRIDEHPYPAAVRREPSLQLSGQRGGRDVDLPSLQEREVVLAGRLTGIDGRRVRLGPGLAAACDAADARLRRLLRRIDMLAGRLGIISDVDREPAHRAARTAGWLPELDLPRAGIRSVVWATGYQRSYPWLHVPVLDEHGEIRHVHGSTPAAGLHVVGMRWQTRRNSSFLDGVGDDARTVVSTILADLGDRARRVRSAA